MKTCSLAQAGRAVARACTLGGLACLSLAAALPSAQAALGGAPTLPAGATSRTLANGTAHVVGYVDAAGTSVNEYVANASGTVVAYTWAGPARPNLDALLGAYAADWRSAAAALHAADRDDLHAARVVGAHVVVETGGHMRGYVGRAWLPDALPVGMGEGDVQ
ncbi:DUF2844 domain-containing protein [Paraburkholderia acidisoli]|uniref:DUF2844 domain-containing protein n=1 Tax=Paraburkholderia acidisoli TaxID=2571748 RepID=A0A7Z2JER8_9BURK|nr:DUF2844 domain-containing protein [Paraburkholderia acidisoli]QGZ61178.1 DUF2844 domain-containing protein [Paraburkholderia acidisoli]